MRRRTGQRAAVATLALALTSTPALAKAHAPARSHAKPETLEHALIHWVNVQRRQHGLGPLAPAAELTAAAHRHTAQMAATAHVFHDPTLGHEVHGWISLGEDVGRAASAAAVEKAFLADEQDRFNLLGPAFRHIGVGTRTRGGLLYVTIVTRRPTAGT